MTKTIQNISVVITAHGGYNKLLASIESAQAAGFQDIVITPTGLTPSFTAFLDEAGFTYARNNGDYSNQAWINGVNLARYDDVILLHDGDILTPDISKLCYDSDVCIYKAINQSPPHWVHSELVHPDYPVLLGGRLALFAAKLGTNSITPGRGVFPKKHILNAFEKYEALGTKDLIVNESLAVGNDLMIWLSLNRDCTVTAADIIGLSLENGIGSTTDRYAEDGLRKLSYLYDIVRRRYNVYWDPSVEPAMCTTCYFNPQQPRLTVEDFLGKSHNPLNIFSLHTLYYDPSDHTEYPRKDLFGAVAFMSQLRLAKDFGYDWMFMVEDDCWLSEEYDATVKEHLAASLDNTVLSGFPVIWHPNTLGVPFEKELAKFTQYCLESTGLPPAIEYHHGGGETSVYTNGALTVYNVPFLFKLWGQFYTDPKRWLPVIAPWDYKLGLALVDIFRSDVFNHIHCHPKIYSGCGDHHLTQAQRNNLKLTKACIHKMYA